MFQRRLVSLLALLVCGGLPVWAGEGFQPIPPEELKMTTEPVAAGAPAIILFRHERNTAVLKPKT